MARSVLALICAVTLAGCGPAQASPEMSREAFRDAFAQKAEMAMPGVKAEALDSATLKITWPDGTHDRLSTATAYEYYEKDPQRSDELMDILLASVREANEETPASRDNLVIIVRPAGAKVELRGDRVDIVSISKPLAGDLIQILAVDSEASIRYAGRDDLTELKLSEAEAWKLGLSNLSMRMGKLEARPLEGAEGLLGVGSESGLGPSALLGPPPCGPGTDMPEGQLALVMARDFFAVPANDQEASLAVFWAMARHEATSPEAFSRTAITCKGGRWIPIAPPRG